MGALCEERVAPKISRNLFSLQAEIRENKCPRKNLAIQYIHKDRALTGVGNWRNYRPKLTTVAKLIHHEQPFFPPDNVIYEHAHSGDDSPSQFFFRTVLVYTCVCKTRSRGGKKIFFFRTVLVYTCVCKTRSRGGFRGLNPPFSATCLLFLKLM